MEIRKYLEETASYYNIYPNIKFNTKVKTCLWNEKTKTYTVTTHSGEEIVANFVISGGGALHTPSIPKFEGTEKFKGPTFHTAQWPEGTDVKNKRVAIIGTGASAVQVVPNIADDVKSLHVFQRTPAWVPPRFDGPYRGITKVQGSRFIQFGNIKVNQ